ncbi:MAG: 1-aminocyclopropane-1-carboxylate deaminase/D-cysteine desulfhydrase [Candidatus Hydrogenedentota bacterium]
MPQPLSLFTRYPRLAEQLPRVELAQLPTPVIALPDLAMQTDVGALWIKHDGETATPYGGNKVRKLEFLLGNAQQDGAKAVMTFGGAGSNHALATAIYARQLGMTPIAMLVPQPASANVRANLLMHLNAGTQLHLFPDKERLAAGVANERNRHIQQKGIAPAIIPAGGSSPRGILGYVNAALELKHEIDAGELPLPDYIYAPCGTMGTAVGLALGFALAGVYPHIVAVRVTEPEFASEERGRALLQETAAFLQEHDASIPLPPFPEKTFTLRHDFFGPGYGVHTGEDQDTAARFEAATGMPMECTYTAKAFGALLADAADGHLRDQNVLYWHTYNAHPLAPHIEHLDWHNLPEAFHPYFITD